MTRTPATTFRPALALLVALALAVAASSAHAALIVVDTLADELNSDGDCSLREAVQASNSNTVVDQCGLGQILGTEDIFIDQSGVIELDEPLLITQQVVIRGRGRNSTTLSGQGSSSHFRVQMAGSAGQSFELRDLALSNGRGSGAGEGGSINLFRVGLVTIDRVLFLLNHAPGANGIGGAIASFLPSDNDAGLVVRQCLFASNSSGNDGGAIGFAVSPTSAAPGSLVIQESSFSNNSAAGFFGGAVYSVNVPIVVIEDSLFRGNSSLAAGGALFFSTLKGAFSLNQIRDSSFLDNQAGTTGGAIQTSDGATLIRNSTFSGNESSDGAALSADHEANTAIFHSTFVDNGRAPTSNGSVLQASLAGEISLAHSIVFSFDAAMDLECSDTGGDGSIVSLGYNIDASGSCTGHASDFPMTDPQLAPLDDYGDGTSFLVLRTFLPLNGPANNGGQDGPCPGGLGATLASDQRGQARPTMAGSNRCDIGAVEVQPGADPTGYPFAVNIATGGGSVISHPGGIDCPGDCTGQFLQESTVTLTAVASPGFAFSGWSGGCSGSHPSCQFTISNAGSATANFAPTSDEVFSSRFEH